MEPITISILVAALATAATKAAEGVAGQAVKDAYDGVKSLIQERFGENQVAKTTLEQFEKNPQTWEAPLAQQLEETGVAQDPAVREATVRLQQALEAAGSPVPGAMAVGDNAFAIGGDAEAHASGAGAIAAVRDVHVGAPPKVDSEGDRSKPAS